MGGEKRGLGMIKRIVLVLIVLAFVGKAEIKTTPTFPTAGDVFGESMESVA